MKIPNDPESATLLAEDFRFPLSLSCAPTPAAIINNAMMISPFFNAFVPPGRSSGFPFRVDLVDLKDIFDFLRHLRDISARRLHPKLRKQIGVAPVGE